MKKRLYFLFLFGLITVLLAISTLSSCDESDTQDTPDNIGSEGGDRGEGNNADGDKKPLDLEIPEIPRVTVIYSENMELPSLEDYIPDYVTVTVDDFDKVYNGPGVYNLSATLSAEGYEDAKVALEIEVLNPEIELWHSAAPPRYNRYETGEVHFVEFEIPEQIKEQYPSITLEYIGNGQSKAGEHTVVAVAYIDVFGQKIEVDRFNMTLVITPYITVTLDPMGGECSVTSFEVPRGTHSISLDLPTPTRRGYTFLHWSTEALGMYEDTTIKAFWLEDRYTISYVTEDDVPLPQNPTSYGVSDGVLTFNEPTRPGYRFLGWYSDPKGGSRVTEINTATTNLENKTLYDRWELITYKITYHTDYDITENPIIPTYSYSILSNPIYVSSIYSYKYGYEFDGWFLEPEFKNKVEVINPADYLRDIDVYAKHTISVLTIFYDLNGGTNNPNNPATYTHFDEDIILLDPTREGYEFLGWYLRNDYMIYGEKITTIDTSRVRYFIQAKWKEEPSEYRITYELNGGNEGQNQNFQSSYSVGTEYLLPTPQKWYYNFLGWYTEPTFENIVTKINPGDKGNKTFYAKWEPCEYYIDYVTYGAILPSDAATSFKYDPDGTAIDLPIPERAGYEFRGWYGEEPDESVNSGIFSLHTNNPESITLYAIWKPATYSVGYDLCYKHPVVEPPFPTPPSRSSYSAEDTYTLPQIDYVYSGLYEFVGWYLDREYTTPVSELGVSIFGDVTLYARWSPISHTVTYNLNGGTNHKDNPTVCCYDTDPQGITLKSPEREGYEFAGWYWEEGGYITLTCPIDTDSTLSATWTPIEYTITLRMTKFENGEYVPCEATIIYTVETPTFTIGDPEIEGFFFWHWTNEETGEYAKEYVIEQGTTGDIVLKIVGTVPRNE